VRHFALTGGIASGKSTVAAMLRQLGCPIVDADLLAREVVEPGQPALAEIKGAFGPGVIQPDGRLDRKALGAIVFADADRRSRLEAITHPRIALRRLELLQELEAQGAPVVCSDIPLLFERGLRSGFDQVWVVWVDRETQLRRLMARDGIGREPAEQRLAAQLPLDDKRHLADVLIDNTGSLPETERQVRAAYAALRQRDGGSPPDSTGRGST